MLQLPTQILSAMYMYVHVHVCTCTVVVFFSLGKIQCASLVGMHAEVGGRYPGILHENHVYPSLLNDRIILLQNMLAKK